MERGIAMNKWKVIELVLLAISSLISAVKGIIKFIQYIDKLRKRPATGIS